MLQYQKFRRLCKFYEVIATSVWVILAEQRSSVMTIASLYLQDSNELSFERSGTSSIKLIILDRFAYARMKCLK